ncbi:phage tail protein [Variovorax sp. OV084]|uniref:phage tail protein n=1 Tax=Variovorax sp. OV084 TaxID=1882777 RepID=UPI0008B43AB9|nr:phage tail protein [Variovorax sp. OV084]SES76304.1 Putative phage tail protein [Variovorax sp. OV084]
MPQAIGYVLVNVAGWTAAAATVAAYAITLVGTMALSAYQKRKAERAAKAQFDAAQVDRLVNLQGTVVPRQLVLGRTRVGGHCFFKTSVGQYKELFVMCVALAEHEIDGIEQIYLNNQPVEVNGLGQVITAPYGRPANISVEKTSSSTTIELDFDPIAGSVSAVERYPGLLGQHEVECSVNGRTVTIINPLPGWYFTVYYQYSGFNSFVRILQHYGSPDQEADGELISMLPGVWTPAHRARGIAYLVCQFAYNDGALPSGIPTVTARIRGAKLYDPRDGVTRFSENPALMMRHVMMHPRFGKRMSMSASEDSRIIAAANACETAINYTGTEEVAMYRSAGVYLEGSPARDVLDDLAQAMAGKWAYASGELFVRAGVYQMPVMDLTEADLAVVQTETGGSVSQSAISINPHQPRNEKVNTVAIRIWDQAANYVETPITPFRADALVADDGAELSQEVTMPGVFYAGQAYHAAGILLRDSRDPLTVTLPFKLRAYPLEIFDTVRLTLAHFGWVNKEFLIQDRTFSPSSGVMLVLKETSAAIFQWGAAFLPGGYAPNTGLPKPWDIHPPQILSVDSGEGQLIVQNDGTILNSVLVTWAPIQDASILNGGTVEVRFRVLPDGGWRSVTVPGDATEARLTGVNDLDVILIIARTSNTIAGSDWSTQLSHTVIGKTEPPPNVENLSISGSVLSWSLLRRVPDLAGFVFRFHYGQNLDWNSAAPLNTGLVTQSPWEPEMRPGGVVTIMIKAQDTSGNQSFLPGSIVMNLGDPPIANVIEQWNYKAMGWPYDAAESSGWSFVSGDPTADPLDSFYGSDNQAFYGGDTDPFYKAESYTEMVYVTPYLPINSALAGSVMTLTADTEGIDLRIEYRFAGPGAFYGPDSDSFYGPDADSFYGASGDWLPWPGQIAVTNDVYQFRVTIGAGAARGILKQLIVTVDAPDMEERIADLPVAAGGTVIPYTKNFTKIAVVNVQLQANASGAITTETDKTAPLAPKIRAFNAAHTSVAGATVDILIQGY